MTLEEMTVREAIIRMAKSDEAPKMVEVTLLGGPQIVGEFVTFLADGFIFNRTTERPPQKAIVRWDDIVCVTVL